MLPVLLSFGPFVLYSGSTCILLSWLAASFTFWKILKEDAVSEEKIFDFMFYITIVGLICARLGYVVLHAADFSHALLKIFALWVAPGLWFYSAFAGMVATAFFLSRRLKTRMSSVLDALAASIAVAGVVASIGTLLEGSEVGKITSHSFGVLFVGRPGLRFPYGLYESGIFLVLCLLYLGARRFIVKHHLPYGTAGIGIFMLTSVFLFLLEFIKDTPLYFRGLTINQWLLIGLFTQCVGAMWVRLGMWTHLKPKIASVVLPLRKKYDALSKRSA
jgi:prolipoprotein diacylglyceryltransferase